jgi:hypothetical protein
VIAPTDLDARMRATADRLIGKYGRSLVLRRRTRVESKVGGAIGAVATSPLSASALVANGVASAGAASVGLRLAGLTGLLVAGDTLLIGGARYVVTGGPYQPSGAGVLATVAVTPVLAGSVADGDPILVIFSGTDFPVKGAVESFSLTLINSSDSQIQSGDLKVVIAQAALDRLGVYPTTKDELYLGPDPLSARRAAIRSVEPIPTGEQDAGVTIHARVAA